MRGGHRSLDWAEPGGAGLAIHGPGPVARLVCRPPAASPARSFGCSAATCSGRRQQPRIPGLGVSQWLCVRAPSGKRSHGELAKADLRTTTHRINGLDLVDWIARPPSSGESWPFGERFPRSFRRHSIKLLARTPARSALNSAGHQRRESFGEIRLEQRWGPGHNLLWAALFRGHKGGVNSARITRIAVRWLRPGTVRGPQASAPSPSPGPASGSPAPSDVMPMPPGSAPAGRRIA